MGHQNNAARGDQALGSAVHCFDVAITPQKQGERAQSGVGSILFRKKTARLARLIHRAPVAVCGLRVLPTAMGGPDRSERETLGFGIPIDS